MLIVGRGLIVVYSSTGLSEIMTIEYGVIQFLTSGQGEVAGSKQARRYLFIASF